MTTPAKLNEYSQAEEPARVLLERLGWTYVPREALASERIGEREVLLKGRLRAALLHLDEPVQRGIRYWATSLRQQLLNSGELKAAAGEPLVDLVGPGSQSVLGGHSPVLRPGATRIGLRRPYR